MSKGGADLLLVDGNPPADISILTRPEKVIDQERRGVH